MENLKRNLFKILILMIIIFGTYIFIYFQDKNTNFLINLAENLLK